MNSGVPQGCILHPALFFPMHINKMQMYDSNFCIFKHADDITMMDLMLKDNNELESSYINHINILLTWCQESCS